MSRNLAFDPRTPECDIYDMGFICGYHNIKGLYRLIDNRFQESFNKAWLNGYDANHEPLKSQITEKEWRKGP